MNLHAITVAQDPRELEKNCLITVATYLASGLDPQKSKIFIQSEVSEHTELAWVFGTLTPLGWLNRMTQFKDKSQNDDGNLGLFAYPVLMASDILLYHADLVPVGEDQKQHLELTRDLAGAFNRRYNTSYFKLPEPLIVKEGKRIMSLQDGTTKMSKSDTSLLARINLNDSAEDILKKIKKSKTDSNPIIAYDEARPEIYNLLNIFASFAQKTPQQIAEQYCDAGFGKFKNDLAEILIANLSPISQKILHLMNDQTYLRQILAEGKARAQEIAHTTKQEVYKIIGLY